MRSDKWGAAVILTAAAIDGVILTPDDMRKMNEKSLSWWRDNVVCIPYKCAYFSDDAARVFDTIPEMLHYFGNNNVTNVWLYDDAVSFAALDYYLLSDGWTEKPVGEQIKGREWYSLHGMSGERYALAVGIDHRTKNRKRCTHKVTFRDFYNIFEGGVANLARTFDVRDADGSPINVPVLSVPETDDAKVLEYLRALYYTIYVCDGYLQQNFWLNLTGVRPDAITSGGIAKKVLLRYFGGTYDDKYNFGAFRLSHPMTAERDRYFRARGLYRGGRCAVNPAYLGVTVRTKMYKYDRNSSFCAEMHKMPDIVGKAYKITPQEWAAVKNKHEWVAAYQIKNAFAVLRPDMIPVFYDKLSGKYLANWEITQDDQRIIWAREWDELCEWYDIDYNIAAVYCWRADYNVDAYRRYVDDVYTIKLDGTIERDAVKRLFGKLLLVKSYGKLAECPIKRASHRVLDDATGAVRVQMIGTYLQDSALLSVIVGSYITSAAAVSLLQKMRETCQCPSSQVIYFDTDCFVTTEQMQYTSATKLGEWKDETAINGVTVPYTFGVFLAPKTYILTRTVDGKQDVFCRAKGVPQTSIFGAGGIMPDAPTNEQIAAAFVDGATVYAPTSINVRGGRVAVPVKKSLCNASQIAAGEYSNNYKIMEDI